MAAPTTLTVTYISTLPSTTSTVTVPLPSASGTQEDATLGFLNIVRAGGLRFIDATGIVTFIPISQITKITVQ